jgi:hypothetical protein
VWEIYDETSERFIDEISKRDTLDSFRVYALSDVRVITLELSFNDTEARVTCDAPPTEENWFEHFLIDVKKCVRSPFYRQLLVYSGHEIYLKLPLVFVPFKVNGGQSIPYSKIIIRQKPPSPFIENIKANLVSNIIWLITGGILVFILQWVLRTYGIDLNPFD